MPRKKRVWYPGATYHVMSRGNRRTAIYKDEADYLEFLECLLTVRQSFGFLVHSICLMTNHFHIAIETKDKELWKIMHKLLLTYAANYNIKYRLTGHLFENRYTAQLIEDERYFLEVSRYIHLIVMTVLLIASYSFLRCMTSVLENSLYLASVRIGCSLSRRIRSSIFCLEHSRMLQASDALTTRV